MAEQVHITKEAWIIRLMQGMVGDYGRSNRRSQCYYGNGGNFVRVDEKGDAYYLNINDLTPGIPFWIIDEKGVPNEPINIINIKENADV
jgi:hypothetical protein